MVSPCTRFNGLLQFVVQKWQDIDHYGEKNCLMVCLELLILDQLGNPSKSILRHFQGRHDKFYRRYGRQSRLNRFHLIESIPQPQEEWKYLRSELDSHRETITGLQAFVYAHFEMEDVRSTRAYSRILQSYEKYCKELERAEARLRDQIGIMSSDRATEMAEISIQESKRVMLCKSLVS